MLTDCASWKDVPVYKFLHEKDVEKVLDGSLMFRPLRFYRELEKTHGPWIGDELENTVKLVTGDRFVTAAQLDRLTPTGGFKFIAGDIVVRNITIIWGGTSDPRFDPYVWCASFGTFPELCRAMCTKSDRNLDPYDACIAIPCFQSFCAHIVDAGIIDGGARVRDLRGEAKAVGYGHVTYGPDVATPPIPSPFLKSHTFSQQREVRWAILPDRDYGDQLFVTFPDARNFMKRNPLDFG
jgi:hypothetical protein